MKLRSPVPTVFAIPILLLLGGCSAIESGATAISIVDGHLTIAVLSCPDGPKNEAVRLTLPPRKEGSRAERLGVWTATGELPPIALLDTEDPGALWRTRVALKDLDPAESYFEAFAVQGGRNHGGTAAAVFSLEELNKLQPGEWLYSEEVYDAKDPDSHINKVTTDLKQLAKSKSDDCY